MRVHRREVIDKKHPSRLARFLRNRLDRWSHLSYQLFADQNMKKDESVQFDAALFTNEMSSYPSDSCHLSPNPAVVLLRTI